MKKKKIGNLQTQTHKTAGNSIQYGSEPFSFCFYSHVSGKPRLKSSIRHCQPYRVCQPVYLIISHGIEVRHRVPRTIGSECSTVGH